MLPLAVAHPLDGARAKLDRAREHVDTLDAETTAFASGDPYDIVRKHYAKTLHATFRFRQKEPPPFLRWGVIIGDVLHEVSSALDHIAWQLALKTRPKPTRKTAWPVCLREGDWESKSVRQMVKHIGDEDRTFIQGKQPYPAPQGIAPETHAFAMLRLLSRIDKHQVLHAAVVMPSDTDATLRLTDVLVTRDVIFYDEPVKHGAKFARVFFVPVGPNPDVNMDVDLTMYVSLIGPEYGHMERGHLFTILHIFLREVERVIDEADARF